MPSGQGHKRPVTGPNRSRANLNADFFNTIGQVRTFLA